jgi:hypothetical protein
VRVMWQGEVLARGTGEPIRFHEAMGSATG